MTPDPVDEDRLQEAIERRFACARCGHCCKGDGIVRVSSVELDAIAAHLGLTRRAFISKYASRFDNTTWVLRDKMVKQPVTKGVPPLPDEQWCIFLERGDDGLYGCSINPVKPRQCAEFPYKWRNDDSLRTCVGLGRLHAALRQEARIEREAGIRK